MYSSSFLIELTFIELKNFVICFDLHFQSVIKIQCCYSDVISCTSQVAANYQAHPQASAFLPQSKTVPLCVFRHMFDFFCLVDLEMCTV